MLDQGNGISMHVSRGAKVFTGIDSHKPSQPQEAVRQNG
jgi:hypothetical protein